MRSYLLNLHRNTRTLRKCLFFIRKYYVWNRSYCSTTTHRMRTASTERNACDTVQLTRVMYRIRNVGVIFFSLPTKKKEKKKKINKLQFGNFRGGCIIGCSDVLWLFTHKISFLFFSADVRRPYLFSVRMNFKCRASVDFLLLYLYCNRIFHSIFHFSFHKKWFFGCCRFEQE